MVNADGRKVFRFYLSTLNEFSRDTREKAFFLEKLHYEWEYALWLVHVRIEHIFPFHCGELLCGGYTENILCGSPIDLTYSCVQEEQLMTQFLNSDILEDVDLRSFVLVIALISNSIRIFVLLSFTTLRWPWVSRRFYMESTLHKDWIPQKEPWVVSNNTIWFDYVHISWTAFGWRDGIVCCWLEEFCNSVFHMFSLGNPKLLLLWFFSWLQIRCARF